MDGTRLEIPSYPKEYGLVLRVCVRSLWIVGSEYGLTNNVIDMMLGTWRDVRREFVRARAPSVVQSLQQPMLSLLCGNGV